MTDKQEQILREKLWDLIIDFDAFQHIRNNIIASSQAENYHAELMKIISQARQEERQKVLALLEAVEFYCYRVTGDERNV